MPREYLHASDAADGEIERRVVGQLADKNRPSLRRLVVQVDHGMVTLRGCVLSFYEKQLAIHSCLSVTGQGGLIDAVEVAAAGL